MSNSRHKFRAWDKKLNTFFPPDGDTWHFSIIGETTMFDLLNQYSIEDYNNLIIEQFTGLQDKNGKDVYEGDWLSDGRLIWVVRWNQEAFKYDIQSTSKLGILLAMSYKTQVEKLEIIGNIHEGER